MKTYQVSAAMALLLAALSGAGAARAQSAAAAWKPTGNVEFVVGAGAGGENDRIARAIQRVLTKEHLVDTMTVLNRPGAGQIIAMNYLAGKKGDANEIRTGIRQLHQRHRAQGRGTQQTDDAADQVV